MVNKGNTPTPNLDDRPQPSLDEDDPKIVSDRYTILDRLGQGGMGKVYQALDSALNRSVAVKVLPFNAYNNEDLRRFQQEARAASKLNHPGIVKALDFGMTDKQEPFLVLEYVVGETLDQVLENSGRLDLHEFIDLFLQISSAMDHAHRNKIVHRDLKPSNIIIRGDCGKLEALVLDFGIAKIAHDVSSQFKTKPGLIVGSPVSISPEQIAGGTVDGRSDIYALGCIMFESLTGKPPFRGKTAIQTMQMHLNDSPPGLGSQCAGTKFPDEIETLVAKCLAKSPDKRFQSMSELNRFLKEMISAIDYQETDPPKGNPTGFAAFDKTVPLLSVKDDKQSITRNRQRERQFLFIGGIVITALLLWLMLFQNNSPSWMPDTALEKKGETGAAAGPGSDLAVTDAESLLDRVDDSTNRIRANEELAETYERQYDFARALPLRQQALIIHRRRVSLFSKASYYDDAELMYKLGYVAMDLIFLRRFRDAEPYLVEEEAVCEKSSAGKNAGPAIPAHVMVTVFTVHANNLSNHGKLKEAEIRYERALALIRSGRAFEGTTGAIRRQIDQNEKKCEMRLLHIYSALHERDKARKLENEISHRPKN